MAAGFVVVLASAWAHASPDPGGFWVSLAAHYRSATFAREWGGFLTVNIPLERLAAAPVERDAQRLAAAPVERDAQRLAEEPPKKESAPAPAPPAAAPVLAPVPRPAPAAPAAPRDPAPAAPVLSSWLARGAVRHALAAADYLGTRSRLASLSARSRSSAALPELNLRTRHSSGQTLRLTPTTDDPYRYAQAGTSELAFEARLTWHLDRLVFAAEEVSIERLQHERDAAERRLIDSVLQRLLEWQRGLSQSADPNREPEQQESAQLAAIGAAVELDVLTDGWFSQAIGESAGQGASDAGEPAKVEVGRTGHAR